MYYLKCAQEFTYSNPLFLSRFSKSAQISNFTKIRPMGAEVFRADVQAGVTKFNCRFSQFCEHA